MANQPPYGPPPWEQPRSGLKPHRGGMVLAFGIMGFVCCFIFAILAWAFGASDIREMDEGYMDPSGRGLTQAGMICGIVSLALAALWIVAYALLIGVMFAAGGFGSGFRPHP